MCCWAIYIYMARLVLLGHLLKQAGVGGVGHEHLLVDEGKQPVRPLLLRARARVRVRVRVVRVRGRARARARARARVRVRVRVRGRRRGRITVGVRVRLGLEKRGANMATTATLQA